LGELIAYEKNERGYVNKSFAIDVMKSGVIHRYFLRQYKRGIKLEELIFEHTMIDHLVAKKFPPVARVQRTRTGKSYVEKPAGESGEGPVFYAIFDYLAGEDRYTWVDPKCTEAEVRRSAEILAQFHSAMSDFVHAGQRAEPEILTLLPTIPQVAAKCHAQSKHTLFDAYLAENLSLIESEVAQTGSLLGSISSEMPRVIIHCDYHPGNLKFLGEEVVGVFDFDWSKIDYRCFDFGLAAFYIFTSWEASSDGNLHLKPLGFFLEAYQKECTKLGCISPLTEEELRLLPAMIRAGNLYVLNWTILDYYGKECKPVEYHQFLKHGIETIKWFEKGENERELKISINQYKLG
jgi:homoserine kinase type II